MMGICSMDPLNPRHIHHVSEVPAHEHVDSGHGGHGDMLSIGEHVDRENPIGQVLASKSLGLR